MPAVSGSQRIKGQIEGAADSVTVVAQPLFDPPKHNGEQSNAVVARTD
jgi:hypothetical protein